MYFPWRHDLPTPWPVYKKKKLTVWEVIRQYPPSTFYYQQRCFR